MDDSVDIAPLWQVLKAQGKKLGDRPFVHIGEAQLSYAETVERISSAGRAFRQLGLERGDRLALLSANSEESLILWLAANSAGIVDVPLNIEARGKSLRRNLSDARPRAVVVNPDRLAEVLNAPPPNLSLVITAGEGSREKIDDTLVISYAELLDIGDSGSPLENQAGVADLATIMYTSGTSGPPKGVMLPHGYYHAFARLLASLYAFVPSDRLYCAQPLYHMDGRMAVVAPAMAGASVTIGGRFSVSGFWDEIARTGANKFQYVGTMLWLLHKQDRSAKDGKAVTLGLGSSTPQEIQEQFEDRFRVSLIEAYGMTECIVIASNRKDSRRIGSVGRPIDLVELAVVDEQDRAVEPNQLGEIVLRPRVPNVTSIGYWRQPEATVDAWRNLWFHTGDLGRLDEDGYLYYGGRLTDSMRHRGENVSAWEVEQALTAHPAVLEAAAIGVASPVGEDDIAALVVLRPEHSAAPAELHTFVSGDLPGHAVPRYIEIVNVLPKTPSERVKKGELQQRGVSNHAWDAEGAAGSLAEP